MKRIILLFILCGSFGCVARTPAERSSAEPPDAQLPADRRCMAGQLSACKEAVALYAKVVSVSRYARQRTVAVLYQSCRQGDASGCFALAKGFEAGRYELPPRKKLGRIYKQLCGSLYPRDPGGCLASAHFARACDLGMPSGCRRYASLLQSGRVNRPHRAHFILRLLRRSCTQGDAKGCRLLGQRMNKKGRPFRASAAYKRGCKLRDASSCLRWAMLLRRGVGRERDRLSEAQLAFERACSLGKPKGCLLSARMLAMGRGTRHPRKANFQRAVKQLLRACDQGLGAGCLRAGLLLRKGTTGAADVVRSEALFVKAHQLNTRDCAVKKPAACARAGLQLRDGLGVAQETEAAVTLFGEACSLGSVMGCVELDRSDPNQRTERARTALNKLVELCASNNPQVTRRACSYLASLSPKRLRGVQATKQGPWDEARLLKRACGAGHPASCSAMAAREPTWNARTLRMFRTSCGLGSAAGCYHLGLVFEFGLVGRPQSYGRAAGLYRRSCRWGLSEGCRRLGLLSRVGAGVAASADAASKLFQRACRRGNPRACGDYAELVMATGGSDEVMAQAKGAERRGCAGGHASSCVAASRRALSAAIEGKDESAVASALRSMEWNCKSGRLAACADLASFWAKGHGSLKADKAKQLAWAEKGFSSPAAASCKTAVALCSDDAKVRSSAGFGRRWSGRWPARSLLALTSAECTLMVGNSCGPVAAAHGHACKVKRKACPPAAKALRAYRKSGVQLVAGTLDEVEKRALKEYEAGCRKRDAAACMEVSKAHAEGRGTKKNELRAKLAGGRACRYDKAYCK